MFVVCLWSEDVTQFLTENFNLGRKQCSPEFAGLSQGCQRTLLDL